MYLINLRSYVVTGAPCGFDSDHMPLSPQIVNDPEHMGERWTLGYLIHRALDIAETVGEGEEVSMWTQHVRDLLHQRTVQGLVHISNTDLRIAMQSLWLTVNYADENNYAEDEDEDIRYLASHLKLACHRLQYALDNPEKEGEPRMIGWLPTSN